MKRKIAVLLSAMMVASAMPMTASAVELKSDAVVNAGFGKVGATIDAKAGEYKNYTTADELKSRESVLKLTLNDDGTDSIKEGQGTFKVTLTNGTFGDLNTGNADNTAFGYKNTFVPAVLGTTTDQTYDISKIVKDIDYIIGRKYEAFGEATGASADGSKISVPENAFKIQGGKIVALVQDGKEVSIEEVIKVDPKFQALKDAIDNKGGNELLTKLASIAGTDMSDAASNKLQDGTLANMKKLLVATTWSAGNSALTSVKNALEGIYADNNPGSGNSVKILPHIPYTIKVLSPTEVEVTPTVTINEVMLNDLPTELVNTGAKIAAHDVNMTFTSGSGKIGAELFKDNADGTVSIAKAEEVKQIANGNLNGYILLCDNSAAGTSIYTNLLKAGSNVVAKMEKSKPYLALPLGGVKVDGNGAVKAKVEADYNTKVKGGEYTITKATGEGSTSLVYPTSSVKSFDESLTLDQVTIKENSRGTIGDVATGTATFTLKLNSGFKFNNASNATNLGLTVTDASGLNTSTIKVDSAKYVGDNQSTIEVKVSGLDNRTGIIGLSVKGLTIAPVNSKNFGDVELTASGNNIDSKTIRVAKREAIGFKLETAKQPKEIVAGRSYEKDTVNMNLQDSQTVEVKFSELVAGSLINSRSLDFNLPEGVKIVNADLSEIRNMNNLAKDDFEIINNGKTLRLKANGYQVNSNGGKNLASFKLKFELSVAPDFAGDIKCTVSGGGQGSDAKVETVIAKAIAPFKIETKNTKINLGYQDYNTADIVITEAKPGMFLQNKEVVIGLKAPFKGGNTIGFSQASYEVSGGELEVKDKDFKVENDVIKFKVNRNSTKNPSTITIKNVKIGTNRSVPFGSYNLTVAGDAVLNNYATTKDSKGNVQVSNEDTTYSLDDAKKVQLANQDRTEYFEIKDYVNVVTETGTFNETVKVSVGEKTVVVGGQTLDMDVAPYIQASSNSTMVPLRFVAVALGVDSANVANPDQSSKVAWDQNSKTVTIYYGAGTGQKIIQFQAGSNVMTVDGTRIPMEYGVKAEIKEGRMFVPFRALGQALGVSVSWDPETRTAIYNAENARNANVTTTTTKETTTATTTATTTTKKEDSTTSTTKAESTTETTTAAAKK